MFISSVTTSNKLLIVISPYFLCRWFWEVVEDRLDEESRARLLQFTTGGCNVPAQGFKVKTGGGEDVRSGESDRFKWQTI